MTPLIGDYLNFARPFADDFSHDKAGSARVLAAWQAAFSSCRVTFPECWSEGRLLPDGHVSSTSDIWLVGHYYGLLETTLGEV